jgi:hypothetical protein
MRTLVLLLGPAVATTTLTQPPPALAAPAQLTTVVTGTGKTISGAEASARAAATRVSGGRYTPVSQSTTGRPGSYTCTLTISYTAKP